MSNPSLFFFKKRLELFKCLRINYSVVRLYSDHGHEKPRIVVTPRVSLMDAKTSFRAEGLRPSSPVTLKAEMFDDGGKLLYSNGHFIAGQGGTVDTSVSESFGGSFKGVFPSGLLSVLKIATGNFEFGTIRKENMREPNKIRISLQDGHVPIDKEVSALDSVELERHLLSPGVKRIQVREGRVRGVLYIPEGKGPFPGVIDMFGATGSLNETRAALNASRGIASLALAYFNYDDIPAEKILNLDLDYFEEAVSYLLSHPLIKSEKYGVVGNCIGGFIAYMMALHLDEIKAAFLINCPIIPFGGELLYQNKPIAKGPNVTYDFLEYKEDGSVITTMKYNEDLNKTDAIILDKMLNTKGVHFSVAIGDKDCYQVHKGWEKVEKHLNEKCFKNLTLKVYRNAGHLIHAPYAIFSSTVYGRMWVEEKLKSKGYLLNFGGDAPESVSMQEDTWNWMFRFFNTHL